MTYREKLEKDFPDKDYVSVLGLACPGHYIAGGPREDPDPDKHCNISCRDCWNSKIPTTETAADDKPLLIIKVNAFLRNREMQNLVNSIYTQRQLGTIILPPYCEPIIVPSDCEIKIKDVKEKTDDQT